MNCRNCGYELHGERFCPQCGCESIASDMYNRTEGGAENYNSYSYSQDWQGTSHSMKWYKAIKVFLLIGAALNIFSAISLFTGASYDGLADEVYDVLPALRITDLFSGVYCIGMTIFNVYVWSALRNYKANAPKLVSLVYVLNIALVLVVNVACIFIVEGAEVNIIYGDTYFSGAYLYQEYLDLRGVTSGLITSIIVQAIVGIVMITVNRSYFKKRQYMFVN